MRKFQVGEIISPHGIKGEMKMWPYVNEKNFFDNIDYLYLGENLKKTKVNFIRPFKSVFLISLDGILSMNDAELMRKVILRIDEDQLPKLENGKYYFFQLLGLEVFTESEQYLGTLDDIIQGAVNDIYVVQNKNGKEILLPAVDAFIKIRDFEHNKLIVRLIEGMQDGD